MKHILIKWLASAASLMLLNYFLPGLSLTNWVTAFSAAVALGVINTLIKPILGLLTLPINLLTFGLFSFVLNACLFGLAAYMIQGFDITNPLTAFIGSILFGMLSTMISGILEGLIKP